MANGGLHCDLFGFVVYLQFDYEVDVFDREGGGGTAGCLLGMDDRRNAFISALFFTSAQHIQKDQEYWKASA